MAATLLVVRYVHLHMRAIQWYFKDRWMSLKGLKHPVFISLELVQALWWWTVADNLSVGRPFASSLPTVTMDARMEGWGRPCPRIGITFHPLPMTLVPGGETASHQCLGAQDSSVDADQPKADLVWPGYLNRVRQHYHCCIHQQGGGVHSRSLNQETMLQYD